MPTFDQLPAEQRAIIELVVQRGRSYDQLADALQITPERVRELAESALVELSPRSAGRVDSGRRPQIADYVLNQQSSAEAGATRTHLKRSESGRMWVLSLLDSLEHMYEKGSVPDVPEAGAADDRPSRAERERPARERAARDRKRPERERVPLRGEKDRDRPRRDEPRRGAGEPLTPEAERAVRNRRIAALVAGVLIIGAAIAVIVSVAGDSKVRKAGAPTTKVIGQLLLNPVQKGSQNQGIAVVAQRGRDRSLIVQAKLKPTGKNEAYEVWLFNSPRDAVSLGAQVTDQNGNYQGAGRLPAPLNKYRYIDVSLEKLDRNPAHSGISVLRGDIANMQAPQAAQQQGAGGQGTAPQQPQQPSGTTP
jgi:hypothetical protein